LIGIFLIRKPEQAIKIEQAFYARINWRLEPIDLPKEVKHTKMMGMALITVVLFLVVRFFMI
jgi:hypothetical protein